MNNALKSHEEAMRLLITSKDDTFSYIASAVQRGTPINELDVQAFIIEKLAAAGLTTDGDKPIVAVNEHAATPHHFPNETTAAAINEGDLILIDLWARKPGGLYADITWMAYLGSTIPEKHEKRFSIIVKAREAAIAYLQSRLDEGVFPIGAEVDEAARSVIRAAGYGERFIHNLGHHISTKVHGEGVNLRGYTEKEMRKVHAGLLFSIEPGIYLQGEAGYRTEIDAYIDDALRVIVTGPKQATITALL